jgi:hypothetical protein
MPIMIHDALVSSFGTLSLRKDAYITLYLETLVNAAYIDLVDLATRLAANQAAGVRITLLLNDAEGLGSHGPHRLGITATADLAGLSQMLSARILVSGSFYRAFGLPGA